MFLFINTAEPDKITVGLIKSDFIFNQITKKGRWIEAEYLLVMINIILSRNKLALKKLAGILVVEGPGGFTSLRVGIITANTLGYSLSVPVVGIKSGENKLRQGISRLKKLKKFKIVKPFYGKEPNITKPKET